MSRAPRALLCAALFAAGPAWPSDPEPAPARQELHFQDAAQWGSPRHVVTPDFPASARKAKTTGQVDVHATVSTTGTLRDVRLAGDGPESEAFVRATESVIGFWQFWPAQGKDCLPREMPIRARIWFEFEGDEPKIFLSTPGRRPPPPPTMKALQKPQPTYPRRALREGEEAVVYARSEVAHDGRVVAVGARAIAIGRPAYLAAFEEEVAGTLRQWVYSPAPEGQDRVRIVCSTVNFKIRD